jgi:uncharacterized protein YkwD
LNRTTNLFVLLLVILFIFPATAIRYAQAATENSQESSDSGNGQDNSSSSTGNEQQQSNSTGNGQESGNTGNGQESGNTGNEQQQSNNPGNAQEMPGATSPSGSTANTTTSTGGPAANATSPIWSAAYNATLFGFRNSTGNMSSADFVKGILALHNRERAAVGAPPLVWNDKLAADAKPWAEHVVTEGHMVHDSEHLTTLGEGENIAGYYAPNGPLALGGGVNGWLDEKKNYHAGVPVTDNNTGENSRNQVGHYIMMSSRAVKEVGCATAYGRGIPYSKEVLGHIASKPNDFMSILVCRYKPAGWQP